MVKTYAVIWERLGNSGIIYTKSHSIEAVVDHSKYLGEACKVTVVRVVGKPVVFGEMK